MDSTTSLCCPIIKILSVTGQEIAVYMLVPQEETSSLGFGLV